ncbi:MAG: hypothetical protein LUE64_04370 [Candidatus Gastranaerophilales bacterium]|nr:hypothetical protein [Candidatus Gastranaerophilales bacterium]
MVCKGVIVGGGQPRQDSPPPYHAAVANEACQGAMSGQNFKEILTGGIISVERK